MIVNSIGKIGQYLEDHGIEYVRNIDRATYTFVFPSGECLEITEELLVAIPDLSKIFVHYFNLPVVTDTSEVSTLDPYRFESYRAD
jgi:hypothetical protein